MGLFSSKKVTTVGTAVARVIEDSAVPNCIKTGVIKSIFEEGEVIEYILEEVISGIALRAERMYEYGSKTYVHGLPSGQMLGATQGKDEVEAVISAIEAQPVLLDYCRFGPPNNLHIGWTRLHAQHAYDSQTNELPLLSAEIGKPVYMKDMVVVIPAVLMDTIQPGELEQWGTPARAGFTPERRAHTGIIDSLVRHSPIAVDPLATEEHLLVTYVWEIKETVVEDHVSREVIIIKEGSFTIPVTGYDDEADYFHAKYILNGVPKYWMYEVGTNGYPTLDAVFDTPPALTGTYFPFAYFRFDKTSEITDKTTDTYKTSRRLVKYLGMNYDQVANAIDENPDIDDVEQAMLIMAVPANTTDPLERRYLYTYFDTLFYAGASQYTSQVQAEIQLLLGGEPDITKSTIVIQDKRFKLALSNGGMYKTRKVGSIGPIGSHDSGFSEENTEQQALNILTNELETYRFPVQYHYYRKQIAENLYDEIKIVNLKMSYHIFGRYASGNDDTDTALLIPVDRSITESYSIPEREILFSRSLHYIFNSRVVTTIKWYQQEWFQTLMIIVAVIILVVSYGTSWEAFLAALAAGTLTVGAIVSVIVALLKYLAVMLLVKLFVKAVGVEAALVIAIIAAIAGVGFQIEAGGVTGAPWATNLLSMSTSLTSAIGQELGDMLTDLMGEANDFNLFITEQTKLLDTAKELLEGNNLLSPLVIFGETPNEYYNRTVHSGNIGVLGINAISSYVDVALTLPKLNDTLGGNDEWT